jgi:hypothetical protein
MSGHRLDQGKKSDLVTRPYHEIRGTHSVIDRLILSAPIKGGVASKHSRKWNGMGVADLFGSFR